MKSGPQKFTGFKGVFIGALLGKTQFIIMARDRRAMEEICRELMPEGKGWPAFEPGNCQKAVLIQAKLLGQRRKGKGSNQSSVISSQKLLEVPHVPITTSN